MYSYAFVGYMLWRYSYLIEYGISASGMVYKLFKRPETKQETDLESDWILLTKKTPPVILEEY